MVETLAVTRKAPSAVDKNTSRDRHGSTSPVEVAWLVSASEGATWNTAGRALLFERVPLVVIVNQFKTT